EGDKNKEAPAAENGKVKVKGLTVYFMVVDRKKGPRGQEGDAWNMGIKDFDKSFVAAADSDDKKLDHKARYLYLYQVVNDRPGSTVDIVQISIRLRVDPRLLTSYGYFREET